MATGVGMDTKAIQVVTPQGLLARVNREWERAEALAGGLGVSQEREWWAPSPLPPAGGEEEA